MDNWCDINRMWNQLVYYGKYDIRGLKEMNLKELKYHYFLLSEIKEKEREEQEKAQKQAEEARKRNTKARTGRK